MAAPGQPVRSADGRRRLRELRLVAVVDDERPHVHAGPGSRPRAAGALHARVPRLPVRSFEGSGGARFRGERLCRRRRARGDPDGLWRVRPEQPPRDLCERGCLADLAPRCAPDDERLLPRWGRHPPLAQARAAPAVPADVRRLAGRLRARAPDDRVPVRIRVLQRTLGPGDQVGHVRDARRGAARVPRRTVECAPRPVCRGRPRPRAPQRARARRPARLARPRAARSLAGARLLAARLRGLRRPRRPPRRVAGPRGPGNDAHRTRRRACRSAHPRPGGRGGARAAARRAGSRRDRTRERPAPRGATRPAGRAQGLARANRRGGTERTAAARAKPPRRRPAAAHRPLARAEPAQGTDGRGLRGPGRDRPGARRDRIVFERAAGDRQRHPSSGCERARACRGARATRGSGSISGGAGGRDRRTAAGASRGSGVLRRLGKPDERGQACAGEDGARGGHSGRERAGAGDRRRRRRRRRQRARLRPPGPRRSGRGAERPAARLDPARGRNASESGDSMRVAIAEDSLLLREGIARVLDDAGFDVVAQCENADDLLLHVRSFPPDVAIVDIRLPPTHSDEGLQAAIELRSSHPEVGVLVLSQYVEVGLALKLVADSAEGVGYLLKDRIGDVDDFIASVRRVAAGRVGARSDHRLDATRATAARTTRSLPAHAARARGARADGVG